MQQETELAFFGVLFLLLRPFKTQISFPPKYCPMIHVWYLERASSVSSWQKRLQTILLSLGTAWPFLAQRQTARQKRKVANPALVPKQTHQETNTTLPLSRYLHSSFIKTYHGNSLPGSKTKWFHLTVSIHLEGTFFQFIGRHTQDKGVFMYTYSIIF